VDDGRRSQLENAVGGNRRHHHHADEDSSLSTNKSLPPSFSPLQATSHGNGRRRGSGDDVNYNPESLQSSFKSSVAEAGNHDGDSDDDDAANDDDAEGNERTPHGANHSFNSPVPHAHRAESPTIWSFGDDRTVHNYRIADRPNAVVAVLPDSCPKSDLSNSPRLLGDSPSVYPDESEVSSSSSSADDDIQEEEEVDCSKKLAWVPQGRDASLTDDNDVPTASSMSDPRASPSQGDLLDASLVMVASSPPSPSNPRSTSRGRGTDIQQSPARERVLVEQSDQSQGLLDLASTHKAETEPVVGELGDDGATEARKNSLSTDDGTTPRSMDSASFDFGDTADAKGLRRRDLALVSHPLGGRCVPVANTSPHKPRAYDDDGATDMLGIGLNAESPVLVEAERSVGVVHVARTFGSSPMAEAKRGVSTVVDQAHAGLAVDASTISSEYMAASVTDDNDVRFLAVEGTGDNQLLPPRPSEPEACHLILLCDAANALNPDSSTETGLTEGGIGYLSPVADNGRVEDFMTESGQHHHHVHAEKKGLNEIVSTDTASFTAGIGLDVMADGVDLGVNLNPVFQSVSGEVSAFSTAVSNADLALQAMPAYQLHTEESAVVESEESTAASDPGGVKDTLPVDASDMTMAEVLAHELSPPRVATADGGVYALGCTSVSSSLNVELMIDVHTGTLGSGHKVASDSYLVMDDKVNPCPNTVDGHEENCPTEPADKDLDVDAGRSYSASNQHATVSDESGLVVGLEPVTDLDNMSAAGVEATVSDTEALATLALSSMTASNQLDIVEGRAFSDEESDCAGLTGTVAVVAADTTSTAVECLASGVHFDDTGVLSPADLVDDEENDPSATAGALASTDTASSQSLMSPGAASLGIPVIPILDLAVVVENDHDATDSAREQTSPTPDNFKSFAWSVLSSFGG
jgi:hypothetical protein